MSFLEVQDLATVAAQEDFLRLLARWCCDWDTWLELGAAVGGVVLFLKGRKIDL
jgi:hypothetical protein